MNHHRSHRPDEGFTLVEIMVAALIASIVVAGVLTAVGYATRERVKLERETERARVERIKLERATRCAQGMTADCGRPPR